MANWDTSKLIISFSQPPPDTSSYNTYYLWINITNSNNSYGLSYYSSDNHTDLLINFTIPNVVNRTGLRVAAARNKAVYLYGSGSTSDVWRYINGRIEMFNVTGITPTPRTNPALVGYDTGFYMHGGNTPSSILSDLWFFDGTAATWKLISNNLNFTASDHSAYISVLPSFIDSSSNITIYFMNNITGPNMKISLVSFDVNKNMSYVHYNGTQRTGAVASLFGTQWFYYGDIPKLDIIMIFGNL